MHDIQHFASLDSTNERLKAIADLSPNGLVVWADEQTAGKGRLGRKWISDKGQGAWFSLLIKDERLTGENAAGLVFVTALAAAKSLKKLTKNGNILIKWPNDIVLNGKKIAGILCESAFDGGKIKWSVCGIGINLVGESFPPELPWAASILSETGTFLSAKSVIKAFLSEFDLALELMLVSGLSAVLDEIKYMSATLGRTVLAELPSGKIVGKATNFSPGGALNIKTESGIVSVNVGDVSVRGVMGYVD